MLRVFLAARQFSQASRSGSRLREINKEYLHSLLQSSLENPRVWGQLQAENVWFESLARLQASLKDEDIIPNCLYRARITDVQHAPWEASSTASSGHSSYVTFTLTFLDNPRGGRTVLPTHLNRGRVFQLQLRPSSPCDTIRNLLVGITQTDMNHQRCVQACALHAPHTLELSCVSVRDLPRVNLQTQYREYEACLQLHHVLPRLPFGRVLLEAPRDDLPSERATRKRRKTGTLISACRQSATLSSSNTAHSVALSHLPPLNASQQRAHDAFRKAPKGSITLVQGPPGTGKTSLLVQVILHYLRHEHQKRLLICAPTNKAVAVIARRVWDAIRGQPVESHHGLCIVGESSKLMEHDPSLGALHSHLWYKHRENLNSDVLRKLLPPGWCRGGVTTRFIEQHVDALRLQKAWLSSSRALFCTLSSSATLVSFQNQTMNFVSDLVVDEAAAATEPSLCIPLQLLPQRLLLVGDPKQLPPLVESKSVLLSMSLQERLMEYCGQRAVLLREQYRMVPGICAWPSVKFYGGNLQNSDKVMSSDYKGSHGLLFGEHPYTFCNVEGTEQSFRKSVRNYAEAQVIAKLVEKMYRQQHEIDPEWYSLNKLRIITFYSAQVRLIEDCLRQNHHLKNLPIIVATVDSSQGCESDTVFVSLVRTNPLNIGFLCDDRRLNVAMTRARFQLIVVGHAHSLSQVPSTLSARSLVEDARRRTLIVDYR